MHTLALVKRVVQIGSRLLTAYFTTLLILLSFHTLYHQHYQCEGHKDGLEITQFASGCVLCDLYHSQEAVVETPFYYGVGLIITPYELRFLENLSNASEEFNCPRGPPVLKDINTPFTF